MIEQAIDNLWAFVLFALVVSGFYDLALLAMLAAGLVIRRLWAWLSRHTWNDVVVLVERKVAGAGSTGACGGKKL